MKPSDVEPLWVHVTCAWFRPEVGFLNHEKMEPAVGLLRIPSTSFLKVLHILLVLFSVLLVILEPVFIFLTVFVLVLFMQKNFVVALSCSCMLMCSLFCP